MTTKIKYFSRDGLMNSQYELIETELSVGTWCVKTFESGHTFSVYEGTPCKENDITFDAERCVFGFGEYTVIETPSATLGIAEIAIIISLVVSVAAIALLPKVPNLPDNLERPQQSPNNNLGARTNRARPLQRIPDIKGTVLSIPDVLMQTYTRYLNLQTKVEYGYYCIGRKRVEPEQIKDGGTQISLIKSASAQVYYPYRSPNDGSPPDIQIGDFIDREVSVVQRLSDVNGIDLPPITATGATPIVFDNRATTDYQMSISSTGTPGEFDVTINEYLNFDDWFPKDYYKGNSVIFNNVWIIDVATLDNYFINGTLLITTEVTRTITSGANNYSFRVVNNGDIPPGVILGIAFGGSTTTEFQTPFNVWYYADSFDFDGGFVNISAPSGIYRDTGGTSLLELTVDYAVEIESTDENGVPSGDTQIITGSLSGNSSVTRGQTLDFTLTSPSRFRLRARRITPKFPFEGVVDNIVLSDIFGEVGITQTDFGDVTTIQTRTVFDEFAAAVKERQLNCIANETLYKYTGGGVFEGSLSQNTSAIQSYITDWVDPRFGGQVITDLDADGLLELEEEILNYFTDEDMIRFDYTVDDTKMTFMEYTQMLFNVINCNAYREGSLLKAKFEKLETLPSTIFTHRSKMPDSETYTRIMNQSQLNDGVELVYVDPVKNTNETIYLPEDKSAVNPKKVEMAGMRTINQALIRANREFNKIKYGKLVLKMSVTGDARFLVPGDVVSVVKGTRMNTYDGDIMSQSLDGYTLTLSNDVAFTGTGPWSIVLKYDDGSIESIGCTAGTETNEVVLDDLPTHPIIDDSLQYGRRTEFSFGSDELLDSQLYYVREISLEDHHTIGLSLTNYDSRFYDYDTQVVGAFSDGFDAGFA